MPACSQRQHPELPSHDELYEAALGFIADGGSYTPAEMRYAITEIHEILPKHLALRFDDGTPAFRNYVAHVLRRFTLDKFHIRHGYGKNVSYTITQAGMAAGQASLARNASLCEAPPVPPEH